MCVRDHALMHRDGVNRYLPALRRGAHQHGARGGAGAAHLLKGVCNRRTAAGELCPEEQVSVARDIGRRAFDTHLCPGGVKFLGHEIRNPLAAIILSLSLFEGVALADEQRRALDRIGNCARSLRRLTADILDIARSRSGVPLPVERRPVDLGAICREIIDELRYQDRAIELAVAADPLGVWDGERIAQVVMNLLLNAIQYSRSTTAIRVEVAGDEREVSLAVVSRGETLSPEMVARIFDPLGRTARRDGMGLGLFIVRVIVQAHDGHVGVQSADGETRFWVRLPRAASQPPERQIAAGT